MAIEVKTQPQEESFTVDLDHLQAHGYVVVDGLVSPKMLSELRAASDRILSRARNLDWKAVRVVGKQFPPWSLSDMADIWGIQHLMNPENKDAKIFLEWYTSPGLVSCVAQILNVPQDELQMELFNLLVNPNKSAFGLDWHRDSIPPEASPQKEMADLIKSSSGTQWNTALYDDQCLIIIPDSHSRVRSDYERDINLNYPKDPIPGQMVVRLKPGQTVFYHNNILHRGEYQTTPVRQTLHACMGHGSARAQNILQHDLSYFDTPEFTSLCKSVEGNNAEKMRLKMVKMAAGRTASDVGFVLKG